MIKKHFTSLFAVLFLAGAFGSLAGCNTVEGAGRGDQRKAYPLKGGLLWRWAYKMQEKPSRFNDAYGKLDALVGIPHEQLMLEMSFPRFFVFQGRGLKPPFSAHAAL